MNENEVLQSICDYLAVKKYYFWRNNNFSIFDTSRKCFRRMPKYSISGVSDIILLRNGMAWFIEVKTEKTVQSEGQKEFEKNVIKNGCKYIVARSIDDLISAGF